MKEIISSSAELQELIDTARSIDAVGMDTEFLWERTYFPRLGLIQLALSDEDCHLIDPLTIDDLSPIGQLLSDEGVVKIFHDAPQDLYILSTATGAVPKNIFDTRLGSGFAGLPSTLSLSRLVKELLDIELEKTQTRTNWLRRPLTGKQIQYALDDVRYLRAARVLLEAKCINSITRNWLQSEMTTFNNHASLNGLKDNQRYTKVKGCKGLSRKSLSVLRELSSWREREARRLDRPRGHILQDKQLICIAHKTPQSLSRLEEECPLSDKKLKNYGKTLLSNVQTGLIVAENNPPASLQERKLLKKEKLELNNLQKLITLECDILGIDPALIGNNHDLKIFIKHNCNLDECQHLRLGSGWRRELISEILSI